MKEIRLKRKVDIRCYHVHGTVLKAEERNEILPILTHISELDGTATTESIDEQLLGSNRLTFARKLINICGFLGLLGENGTGKLTLSEAGVKAVENKKVFVPEDGSYLIWLTDDPLITGSVLKIKPKPESAMVKEKNNVNERAFINKPKSIRSIEGLDLEPVGNKGDVFRFEQIKDRIEEKDSESQISVEWVSTPDSSIINIQGELGSSKLDVKYNKDFLPFQEHWMNMLESNDEAERWDDENHRLLRYFEETDETSRSSFLSSIEFQWPHLAEFGRFETTVVEDVPIGPIDENEANIWANWLVNRGIRDYTTEKKLAEIQDSVEQHFAEYSIEFESINTIISNFNNKCCEKYWHLQAPMDWSL